MSPVEKLKLPQVLKELKMSRAAFYRLRARGQAPELIQAAQRTAPGQPRRPGRLVGLAGDVRLIGSATTAGGTDRAPGSLGRTA